MNVIEVKNVNRSFENGKEVAHVLKDVNLPAAVSPHCSIFLADLICLHPEQ